MRLASTKGLLTIVLGVAVAACADTRLTEPEPALTLLDPGFVIPAWVVNVAASSDVPLFEVVVDPTDPNTETHTFDDLPVVCAFNDTLPNPYEGLTFLSTPYFTACASPNGTVGLIPSDQARQGVITETFIDLRGPASAASLEVIDFWTDRDLTLNAYDAAGVLVASATDPTDFEPVTLSVSGDIHRLGIATDQANTFIDDLTITYVEEDVLDKDACKKDGWSAFGFKNQGQCVRFVENGKDRR